MKPEEKEESPNTNCLQGMRCPECKSYGPFTIRAQADFLVHDDGTDAEYSNVEWDDKSPCVCDCGHDGKVKDFKA